MKYLINHIPDAILEENKPLQKFVAVLQGMEDIEDGEIRNYVNNFLYPLVYDIRVLRRYVDEWKAEYTEESTRICLDCLYRNYYDIYSKKGTAKALQKLLQCLFAVDVIPEVTINNYTIGKPLILSDNNKIYDFLPEGQEVANEYEALAGEEIWCPTLLDDNWDDNMATLEVTIENLNYTPTPEFMVFINSVIVLYLPMVSKNFVNTQLNII